MTARQTPAKTAPLTYEARYAEAGHRCIVGLDEAGRGAWAGPVAAGAVWLPSERADLLTALAGVRDSKQMTARQRARLVETIKVTASAWGIGAADAAEIDSLGIMAATRLAMARALENMRAQFPDCSPDCLFLDTMPWPDAPLDCPRISILRGDQHALSIAAASVLAKTWRDAQMAGLDAQYPGYGFALHKGYGTARHQAALRVSGASPAHRLSFRPLRALADPVLL